MFQPGEPVFTDKEKARAYWKDIITQEPPIFSTYPWSDITNHAFHGLMWIDCAPEGANFIIAPLQGKDGRPCGYANNSENLGPNKAVRAIRAARDLNPFTGDLDFRKKHAACDPLD